MKQVIKLSIMIVISLIAFSKGVAWSNTDTILIAKDSTKTLQMEISLPATQFLLGEPVLLQVKIKNMRAEPIRFPYEFALGPDFFNYAIEGPAQPQNLFFPYMGNSKPIFPPDEKWSHFLNVGEEESTTINLVTCRIMKSGHYKVNATFSIPQLKELNPPFFEGKLVASLEFDVLQPSGEDAAFLESLQQWFEIQKIPAAQRCYYHIYNDKPDCTDEIFRKHSTSRLASWLLIKEIMVPPIVNVNETNKGYLRYSSTILKDYICDSSSPNGKKELIQQSHWSDKLRWENETIDNILKLHPLAPFSASLTIQKALNVIALGDESNGLKLMQKFIQVCNDKKIVSRECNWAKEFVELWVKRKQAK